jgi:hypothetical protein
VVTGRRLAKFGGLAVAASATLAAGTLGAIAEAAEAAARIARTGEGHAFKAVARGALWAGSARGAEQRKGDE